MKTYRLFHGSPALWRAVCCAVALTVLLPFCAHAADEFPFERELILDAKRMGPSKRFPMLTVEQNGNAVIDLWCKTVPGRIEITGGAIKIEAAPLPEELPSMIGPGQCTPERMQADQDLLTALTQVTEWQGKGDTVVLSGPAALRFHASSH
ncbi:META domain-containing protein [Pseudolabrys taiwanensis]|nr:META domain-containing protein [Pseudolabrys taiwanensis]